MKYSIDEIKKDAFITFGGKQYLPKDYATMLFEEIQRLEKRMENVTFTDSDYNPKPKRTIQL